MKPVSNFLLFGPDAQQLVTMQNLFKNQNCLRIQDDPKCLAAYPKTAVYNDLHIFSLPYGLTIYKDFISSNFGHFVTTNSTGLQKYGTYYNYMEKVDTGKYISKSLCVLSDLPLYKLQRSLLSQIVSQTAKPISKATWRPFKTLWNPISISPTSTHVKLIHPELLQPLKYSKELPNYAFTNLTDQFRPENIIDIFCCLMLEHKILMESSNPCLLAPIGEALRDLLYPIKWRHVFVPYLPESINDYIEAPVPFIMGILRGNPATSKECVRVDIDRGKVTLPDSIQLPSPPAPQTTLLYKELTEIMSSNDGSKQRYLMIKNAFKNYMLQIFTDVWVQLDTDTLDEEKFIENQPDFNQNFWRQMAKTEGFQRLISNKESKRVQTMLKDANKVWTESFYIYKAEQESKISTRLARSSNTEEIQIEAYHSTRQPDDQIMIKNLDTGEMVPIDQLLTLY